MRKIILASGSPRRVEILKMSGIPFDVEESGYEEDMTEKLPPEELVQKLALGKALSVVPRHSDAVIIGADTFVVLGARVLGKPHTEEKAREMLHLLSGTEHWIITGYAIVDTKTGMQSTGVDKSKIKFREISSAEIEQYIETGEPLDKAGAYAIQGGGAAFVEKVEGDKLSMMGLPLTTIVEKLKELGVTQ